MCGISGFINKNLSENKKQILIKGLNELQVHRGPDFSGEWNKDSNTHFFHQRLSLIDGNSRSNQPFYTDDFVLCFNGEIYNFLALKQHLPSVNFITTSDTEVLFQYLIHFGIEKTLRDIKGMFAFSFYDVKKKELFLVRDRFGIKPLFFVNNSEVFAFASESRTLAKALQLKPDSYKTIMALNSTLEGSSSYSLFNNVVKVKAGTVVKIASNLEISEDYYYKLSDQVDANYHKELAKKPKSEIVKEFDNLLSKSVEEMLVSDFPMGSFVSGGIDSSILTAMAKKSQPNIQLFTADIVGKHSEYADSLALANHLDLPLHKTEFHPEDFLKHWITATEYNAAPIVYFTNGVPISRVAHLARQNSVKAVICGEGSDELFLGYSKLMAARYKKALLLPHEILKKVYKIYPTLHDYLFPSSSGNLDAFNIRLANAYKSEMLYEKGSELFSFVPKNEQKYYLDSFEMMQKHLQALLYRNDRMGMISSIEVRFPFLHEDVVKFGLNLPLEYKTRWTTQLHNKKHPFITDKWIVREVAKNYLPQNLVAKKKNGLPIDGLNGVRFTKEFFKNGYVAQNLQLDDATLDYMIRNENPYFIGKLASVELFGLLYDFNESHQDIQQKIDKYSKMKV
ncbi:MAG: asparagine synthase (glutamine-hydrolyzing) [Bacteroidota bacterium]